MAGPELESDRLRLRQWQHEDFEIYADYYGDRELSRFIGGPCDRHQAWRRWAAEIGHWAIRGHGFWAVEDKESKGFVGAVGLWRPDGWPELELGYWLMPAAQGKGYATEAARRARDYARDVLGAGPLVSFVHPDNEASKRVAERVGAQLEGMVELVAFGEHCAYRHPRERD